MPSVLRNKNKPPFPATVSGLISAAKKATALTGKKDALKKLALNENYYPSAKILVGTAALGAGRRQARQASTRVSFPRWAWR